MKLSIIIPVYNVEDFLQECLDSVLCLEGEDWEVIAVDDGSTDSSSDILDSYSGHQNVKIIHTPNGGSSAARNRGMSEASGEYVAFIDSDDTVDAGALRSLIDLLDGQDVLAASYMIQDGDGTLHEDRRHILPDGLKCDGPVFIRKYLSRASAVVWRSIWRRELIASISFHEGVRFEDVEWSLMAYHYASLIECRDIPFYYYRLRNGSIMSSHADFRTLSDAMTVCQSLLDSSKDVKDRGIRRVYEIQGLHGAIYTALRSRKSLTKSQKRSFVTFLRKNRTTDFKYAIIRLASIILFSF
ncbi:MAG: glycosyltransferase [Bacteroidales bacterium]|nr:glycosyltransferase [Bacteroidales bacterium]